MSNQPPAEREALGRPLEGAKGTHARLSTDSNGTVYGSLDQTSVVNCRLCAASFRPDWDTIADECSAAKAHLMAALTPCVGTLSEQRIVSHTIR